VLEPRSKVEILMLKASDRVIEGVREDLFTFGAYPFPSVIVISCIRMIKVIRKDIGDLSRLGPVVDWVDANFGFVLV
jgi:hypothetical protein